jgi:hypothetical protein
MIVDSMEFLASGLLALKDLGPDERARWRSELFRELEQRGGLTDDGQYVDKAIASELFSEVVERATRYFATELIQRTREYMSEDETERLEVELGNSLRRALDLIASKWS